MIHGQHFVITDFEAPAPVQNLFEITYIKAGKGIRIVKGKKQKISSGNFFLSEPRCPAEMQDVEGLEVIRLLFLSSFIDQAFPTAYTYQELSHSFLLRFVREISTTFFIENLYMDTDGRIGATIEEICEEETGGRDGHLELTRCRILEIILRVFRQCSERRDREKESLVHHTFIRVYDYCQKNYATDIKLGDLCKELHYSLPYLSARFKEIHGCTFTQLVQRFRVEEACRLLLSGDKRIEEISELVGYSDVRTFFKIFKRYTGTTPLQYRKKHGHLNEV